MKGKADSHWECVEGKVCQGLCTFEMCEGQGLCKARFALGRVCAGSVYARDEVCAHEG